MRSRCLTAFGLTLLLAAGGCSPTTPEPANNSPATVPPSVPSPAPVQAEKGADARSNAPAASASGKEESPSPATPDALVEQAEKTVQAGDLAEAIRLLERALTAEPDHRKALYLLAVLTQEQAIALERPQNSPLYLQSAATVRKLRDRYKDLDVKERELLPLLFYNEACTLALGNQPEKALDVLGESIDAGFSLLETLRDDKELDSLRKLPRFADLIKTVEARATEQARENARKLVDESTPFPFQFALPGLDGKTIKLDDVKGKVTIVDIWGTWCPPCRKEIPHFKELLAKYRDRGLVIVGINYERVDEAEVKKTIDAFLKENQVPYTCLIGDEKTQEQVPGFEGFPTTLFLDRSGTVRAKVVGYHPYADLEAIVDLLLGEEATK